MGDVRLALREQYSPAGQGGSDGAVLPGRGASRYAGVAGAAAQRGTPRQGEGKATDTGARVPRGTGTGASRPSLRGGSGREGGALRNQGGSQRAAGGGARLRASGGGAGRAA